MFNIVSKKKIFFTIPLVVILVGIICFFSFGGFNLDIDFAGGTEMMFDAKTTVDKDELNKVANDAIGITPNSIQQSIMPGKETQVTIKIATLSEEQSTTLWNAVKTKYSLEDSDRLSVESVSPTMGKDLTQAAAVAAIITVILMLLYISVRFEFLSALSAVVALLHDSLIMISMYAIFRMPVNTMFIAAILTVLGYSINATIVVFDRVRENVKISRRESFGDVVNTSIWNTMTRSINTSLTTLIMIVVLYIMGVDSMKEFTFALAVGIISGTYSSIFIAGPMWTIFRKGTGKKLPAGKKKV